MPTYGKFLDWIQLRKKNLDPNAWLSRNELVGYCTEDMSTPTIHVQRLSDFVVIRFQVCTKIACAA